MFCGMRRQTTDKARKRKMPTEIIGSVGIFAYGVSCGTRMIAGKDSILLNSDAGIAE